MGLMPLFISAAHAAKPNIVFILCDDLGYGDVRCLNPGRGRIATPAADRLADEGMIFTDAHSGSSVCTPTRYGILTGRYSWRTHLQSGVLKGFSEPLIAKGRLTVPALLKQHGYTTGIIGKWHLGMSIPQGEESPQITDGPTTRGFDSYFGISPSLDMQPYGYIENDHFTKPIRTRKAWQQTGAAADVLPTLTKKAVEFIGSHAKSGKPFFLYLPLTSPHTPIVPSKEWQGKSSLGAYGDFVMQTDWALGEVVAALDKAGVGGNTLVIFTSDNGCSKAAGIPKLEKEGHYPCAGLRGSKADIWEGGHRVPFIARWPATVKAGSRSDETICLTDLFATCAELTGAPIPAGAAEDSVSFLPALEGKPIASTRAGVVHHSISGHFAYRMGKWKLCLARASGGWSSPNEQRIPKNSPAAQLYDMEADPGETTNLYAAQPEVAARLLKQLEADIARGRSTDGPQAANDVKDIRLWKSGEPVAGPGKN